ncbi:hypothetical protein QC761_0070530 [Podospora bellae-mahoneyi]|uniref:Uncharacterized protein n=1 Tax=Podospora bellae-mahoneyi TaxID=2093777 RepID=A0ABR0FIB9_9PEZI|nr:hypothetical protein QC761_0070530 [Podospora bellae-mahoneyi]
MASPSEVVRYGTRPSMTIMVGRSFWRDCIKAGSRAEPAMRLYWLALDGSGMDSRRKSTTSGRSTSIQRTLSPHEIRNKGTNLKSIEVVIDLLDDSCCQAVT